MRIFISHSAGDRELVDRIAERLARQGLEVIDPFTYAVGSELVSKIFSDMRSADAVLALVSTATPNVFYELGVAVGAGLPVLLMGRSNQIPPDVAALPFVQATGDVEADAQLVARTLARILPSASAKSMPAASPEKELQTALIDSNVLESLGPNRFEYLIGELLRSRGFQLEGRTEGQGTGSDFAILDGNSRLLVEVKKTLRQNRIAVDVVRALLASVHVRGARGGVLISSSDFTAAARDFARGTAVSLRTLGEVLGARSLADLWRQDRTVD